LRISSGQLYVNKEPIIPVISQYICEYSASIRLPERYTNLNDLFKKRKEPSIMEDLNELSSDNLLVHFRSKSVPNLFFRKQAQIAEGYSSGPLPTERNVQGNFVFKKKPIYVTTPQEFRNQITPMRSSSTIARPSKPNFLNIKGKKEEAKSLILGTRADIQIYAQGSSKFDNEYKAKMENGVVYINFTKAFKAKFRERNPQKQRRGCSLRLSPEKNRLNSDEVLNLGDESHFTPIHKSRPLSPGGLIIQTKAKRNSSTKTSHFYDTSRGNKQFFFY